MYRIKPTVVRILVGVTISVALAWGAGPAYAGINSLYPADSSTLTAASQTFSWDGTDDITEYWLYLGTSVKGKDILDSGTLGTAPSTTVNGLPADGSTVYARLWHKEGGSWLSTDFTYTAFTASGGGGGEAGGRLGWELPMRNQLASLVDPSNLDLSLPTGHPFQNVQSAGYWSATSTRGVCAVARALMAIRMV